MMELKITQDQINQWYGEVDPLISQLARLAAEVELERERLNETSAPAAFVAFVNRVNHKLIAELTRITDGFTDLSCRPLPANVPYDQ